MLAILLQPVLPAMNMLEKTKFSILMLTLALLLAGPVYWWVSASTIVTLGLPINIIWLVLCAIATSSCLYVFEKSMDE